MNKTLSGCDQKAAVVRRAIMREGRSRDRVSVTTVQVLLLVDDFQVSFGFLQAVMHGEERRAESERTLVDTFTSTSSAGAVPI
jgi:hypothetical protein